MWDTRCWTLRLTVPEVGRRSFMRPGVPRPASTAPSCPDPAADVSPAAHPIKCEALCADRRCQSGCLVD